VELNEAAATVQKENHGSVFLQQGIAAPKIFSPERPEWHELFCLFAS
jgi:hypothetical protein